MSHGDHKSVICDLYHFFPHCSKNGMVMDSMWPSLWSPQNLLAKKIGSWQLEKMGCKDIQNHLQSLLNLNCKLQQSLILNHLASISIYPKPIRKQDRKVLAICTNEHISGVMQNYHLLCPTTPFPCLPVLSHSRSVANMHVDRDTDRPTLVVALFSFCWKVLKSYMSTSPPWLTFAWSDLGRHGGHCKERDNQKMESILSSNLSK